MADNTLHPRYHTRIDLKDSYQRRFWADKLEIDIETLREVIDAVGPEVEDVLKYVEQLRAGGARRPAKAARPTLRTKG